MCRLHSIAEKSGIERKLYCRELIARFGHALALNWNIGEENTQSSREIIEMSEFIRVTDPYRHPIVLHTFPQEQEKVYQPLLGKESPLTGLSLQNSWDNVHQRTLHWIRQSGASGKPWVVANDEQNPAGLGVPPDPGYQGHDGVAATKGGKGSSSEGYSKSKAYTLDDIRKLTLWGNLMAGGAGVEYYFGYSLPENDLLCEDLRSRDRSWDYCRIALDFFREKKIPFAEMSNANEMIGNSKNDNSKYCFAKYGEIYLVYLPAGGTTTLDLTAVPGTFSVSWFNPRAGGPLEAGSVKSIEAGKVVNVGHSPRDGSEDWLVVVRR
ncbi:MAG: putative collagen-binding domain-containing protein [Verrucomicrobiales bacterium]